MEKDLVGGELGTVGAYDLAIHGTQLAFTVKAGVPVGGVELLAKVELEEVLKLIAAKIPGSIDDAVIGLIISSLKA